MLVITDEKAGQQAFLKLKRQLESVAQPLRHRSIGFQGGNVSDVTIHWLKEYGYWVYLQDNPRLSRYWICFGRNPDQSSASIAVECNPPKTGINRQAAGTFLSAGGGLFLGHSGKVGGGKKGIGKTEFLSCYKGTKHPVDWPDGKNAEVIVIGRIGSPEFPRLLGRFVEQVARFKSGAEGVKVSTQSKGEFSPEFKGLKSYYASARMVQANCRHGDVVDALRAMVASHLSGTNDQARDLVVEDKQQRTKALFEVKTSCDTASVYGAIGQLFYHGVSLPNAVPRVLVLPGIPAKKAAAVLARLNVTVLTYEFRGVNIRFGKVPPSLAGILTS